MQCTVFPRPFCLSVCPSVERVHCDKTKETCAHILIPHDRSFILGFWQSEWLVGDDPVYLKFSTRLLERKRWFSVDIGPSHSTWWKSPINTNRKSTTRFPLSLRWTCTLPLSCSKGGSKTQTAVFCVKLHFTWRKCYTVSLCEYCRRQSCKAFTGLSICAKILGKGCTLKGKISCRSDPPVSARVNASHADKQQNTTHILFASQRLQCSMKFITIQLNWTQLRYLDEFWNRWFPEIKSWWCKHIRMIIASVRASTCCPVYSVT